MSAYNGRRAPNVSQYLANLNTVPSAQELAQNDFDLSGDSGLDFLTNTEFFDFDNFDGNVAGSGDFAAGVSHQKPQPPGSHVPSTTALKFLSYCA
jgi:hypothetical protein